MTRRFQCAYCDKQLDIDKDSDEEVERKVRDGHIHIWVRLENKE